MAKKENSKIPTHKTRTDSHKSIFKKQEQEVILKSMWQLCAVMKSCQVWQWVELVVY